MQPVAAIGGGGAQNADVQFLINGPDLKKLEAIGQQLVEKVKAMPGVVDVDTSLNVGKPELSVADRSARRRRTSACRSATRPKRCACWSAAIR